MKPADVYAYNQAQIGHQFVSFLTIKSDGRKSVTVGKHTVVEVTPGIVRLDNGIAISRTTGKVVGVINQPRANMPSFFPATPSNMARAIRSQG
jgi:hypothetical protein